ncbi:MAG: 6-pyruvoyl-tetrahydropterin synthase-related protein [Candidatus Bathyarchaeia archaeon]
MKFRFNSQTPLVCSIMISALTVLSRFSPGIPEGVDSTSHLNKILFIIDSYKLLHYIPSWCPDWYGGSPFLLLYSPLSYILTFSVALTGIDGVLAYKIVDAAFYVVTPITIYILSRGLDLKPVEAAWASLIFTLTPTVIGNFLFYDRFPNIVALPIACLFVTSLSKMLRRRSAATNFIASILLLSILILTHHLSAFIVLILVPLAYFSLTNSKDRLKAAIMLVAVIGGALTLSSPWLLRFLEASGHIMRNPFYNRTVDFPFVRLTYAIVDYLTIEQGIFHFCLAILSIYQLFSKNRGSRIFYPIGIMMLLTGMGVFEFAGDSWLRILGQGLIVASFLSMIWSVLSIKGIVENEFYPTMFLSSWFLVFLWLSLGNYAMPMVNLPVINTVWRSLDVHRFWLYLAIPASLLAGKVAANATRNIRRTYSIGFIVILTVMIISASMKGIYAITQDVNPHLPYTTENSEIPQQVIDYFKLENDYGRILPIRCPMWIYLLPRYVGKPIIDGWYPQEKLISDLLKINDYRINDLETSENRTRIWKWLIERNQNLAIRWIIVGNANSTLINTLANSTFKVDNYVIYGKNNLTILKNSIPNPLIELHNKTIDFDINYCRPAPDTIFIEIKTSLQNVNLTVREAYDAGWRVEVNNVAGVVQQSPEGMISIHVVSTPSQIILNHYSSTNTLSVCYISGASTIILSIVTFWPIVYKRKFGEPNN